MALARDTSLLDELAADAAEGLTRYRMCGPGARVGVALSGGMDSWSLLALLDHLRRTDRFPYPLTALHIDLGYPGAARRLQTLTAGCHRAEIPLIVRHTAIGPESLAAEKVRPCFLCARRRRQALYEIAARENLTHLATGHHRDDVLASFFMNLIENRELSTLLPRQEAFQGRFQLIRPLYLVPKKRLIKLQRQQNFPVFSSGCPVDGQTRRRAAEELVVEIERRFPGSSEAIFQALHRPKTDFLPVRDPS
ncbi:MAG: tRNA 2-thiocytidine biosynthesis protein TtcA [Myxococcales bacterium]|nr:tRNA 2-thiocytidine biosynthesis protein TtcA [Myxococcales bacterium]